MAIVHLVDASPYIFRAYFSLPASMSSPDGQPVNAVQGFSWFLLELAAKDSLTHAAVAFDESLTTSFRNELDPAYKAQRELPPVELEAQLKACREMAEALGFACFASDRYEADDLIAALCGPLLGAGHGARIVSPDKDLAQLVEDGVELLDWARQVRSGPAEVLERFGVPAARVPDWLALVGDAVDNIPGVPGVGPKTATALLQAFGTVEELFARLDDVASLDVRGARTLRAKLEGRLERALLSKRLATVAREAPVRATLDELAWHGADRERFEPLAARLGFERLASRVPRWRSRGVSR